MEEQDLENPYAVNTSLRDSFATGWYTGYIGTQVLLLLTLLVDPYQWVTVPGAFEADLAAAMAKLERLVTFLKPSNLIRATERIGAKLIIRATVLSQAGVKLVVEAGKTAVVRIRAAYTYLKSGLKGKALAESHPDEYSKLIVWTPGDAANVFEPISQSVYDDIFSITSVPGVSDDYLVLMRARLIKVCLEDWNVNPSDIYRFTAIMREYEQHNNAIGLQYIVKRMSRANSYTNFIGIANEADIGLRYARIPGNLVEFTTGGARYDIIVTNAEGIVDYIEIKKINPDGVLNGAKVNREFINAQNKFMESSGEWSDGTTVLDINAEEGEIWLNIDDEDILLSQINAEMITVLTDQKYGNVNYISKLIVRVPNREPIIFVRNTIQLFRKP